MIAWLWHSLFWIIHLAYVFTRFYDLPYVKVILYFIFCPWGQRNIFSIKFYLFIQYRKQSLKMLNKYKLRSIHELPTDLSLKHLSRVLKSWNCLRLQITWKVNILLKVCTSISDSSKNVLLRKYFTLIHSTTRNKFFCIIFLLIWDDFKDFSKTFVFWKSYYKRNCYKGDHILHWKNIILRSWICAWSRTFVYYYYQYILKSKSINSVTLNSHISDFKYTLGYKESSIWNFLSLGEELRLREGEWLAQGFNSRWGAKQWGKPNF